ncbi:hypothetical protein AGABI1DRAFT_117691 [Agaricus bisporus var. burnettii JB137-S8]|uniref:alpha-1,2-Mannosidase n=1 Tax=Agaricus bisporus var. burnettii (strain JB137-S8 / ATCC MYA-4627 / FGSC 10392) TaxID=597362 RepID=K5XL36_AGABU|nr:uncharacterized protein AGABI1DRAFT_117691 [Agaricus bisporus var. burnettii JB137-S8]EKM84273.1 hypothetical protein AGABI1DRAFT_117691 [Agaricus bisporus var. burnettii JB137-S8]
MAKQKGKIKRNDDYASKERNLVSLASDFLYRHIWSLLILCLAVCAYFQPHIFSGFIRDWIGFSDHWDTAPLPESPQFLAPHARLEADTTKQQAVVQAFKHAWLAYERDAMGADEYHPISHEGTNLTEAGGIGYTVVDSLDTMLIMGLYDEYHRARRWVNQKLTFDVNGNFSTFETTIRILGGLLSAYELTAQDPLLLEKAIDLADRILPVFETTSGLPLPIVNLAERKGYHTTDFPGLVSVAEVGTLQLEFKYLSEITRNPAYEKKVKQIMEVVDKAKLPHGMASIFMNIEDGEYIPSSVSLGSRADSYYEYLLKQYIQTNFSEPIYRDMYLDAMSSVQTHLFRKTQSGGLTYTSELQPEADETGVLSWRLVPKQDHLACFLPGSLMLGAVSANPTVPRNKISYPPKEEQLSADGLRDWKIGHELLKTCLATHETVTGLSPEIAHFRIASDGMDEMPNAPPDWYIRGAAEDALPSYNARYMLRPETIESLFIAYRLTGDNRFRDHGWNIFQAIEKHCRVDSGGYTTIISVAEIPTRREDKMETFFLSETLKYLYLLFSDDRTIPLDRYVFNTEAHPLPIFKPSR